MFTALMCGILFKLGFMQWAPAQCSVMVGASQSISSLTELTSLSHNDVLPITEVNGLTTKKVKWGTATSTLKVINDALYSPLIGSASITTLGTITTGTWNADTLTVAKGGTGSTSLIAHQLLAGNGTGAVTTFGNGTSGYVLTSNGAGALPSFQNVGVTLNNNNTWTGTNTFTATTTFSATSTFNASTTFNGVVIGISDVQTFLASSTWYKPAQTASSTLIFVECWGAGGAGGGLTTSDGGAGGGGGGGGGAYFSKIFPAVELTSSVAITIGSGGTGVAGLEGNAGGNTTFGSYLTAYGGGGGGRGTGAGTSGSGGGGGGAPSVGGTGSQGGAASTGGGYGGSATLSSSGFAGGFGAASTGGAGGNSVYGGAGGSRNAAGASSVFGGAGGGSATGNAGGTSVYGGAGGAGSAQATGGAGTVPGGGGGAPFRTANDSTAYAGGAGANGKCIVTTQI